MIRDVFWKSELSQRWSELSLVRVVLIPQILKCIIHFNDWSKSHLYLIKNVTRKESINLWHCLKLKKTIYVYAWWQFHKIYTYIIYIHFRIWGIRTTRTKDNSDHLWDNSDFQKTSRIIIILIVILIRYKWLFDQSLKWIFYLGILTT
jgi:hypothetical protein